MSSPDLAARLAHEHDAATLAEALVARLLVDGRAEFAADLRALLSGEKAGIIDPTPPYPRQT